jgi:hypothetical protein
MASMRVSTWANHTAACRSKPQHTTAYHSKPQHTMAQIHIQHGLQGVTNRVATTTPPRQSEHTTHRGVATPGQDVTQRRRGACFMKPGDGASHHGKPLSHVAAAQVLKGELPGPHVPDNKEGVGVRGVRAWGGAQGEGGGRWAQHSDRCAAQRMRGGTRGSRRMVRIKGLTYFRITPPNRMPKLNTSLLGHKPVVRRSGAIMNMLPDKESQDPVSCST